MNEPALPEAFGGLAPFVGWALEPERARTEKREAASMEEVRDFYDAMMLRMGEVIAYLDDQDGSGAPAQAHRLFLMSLSLVEVAPLVEMYKRRESVHACDPLRYVSRF